MHHELPARPSDPGTGVQHLLRAIPAVKLDDLRVAVAKSPAEFEAAQGLVCRRYRWRGYEIDGPVEGPEGADAAASLRREITIVAAAGGGMIGTCTLGFDGPHGLRADVSYGDIISRARDAGRRVGEITRLAVDSTDSKPVLASLFNLAYVAGKAIGDVTDVFIEINPRHVLFYTRMLGFTAAAGERVCARVGAPSVLLHVEMAALAERLEVLSQRALLQAQYAQAA
jgi:hypothetical protein